MGHRSIEAVRVYKEILYEQEQEANKMIQPRPKKYKDDKEEESIP